MEDYGVLCHEVESFMNSKERLHIYALWWEIFLYKIIKMQERISVDFRQD